MKKWMKIALVCVAIAAALSVAFFAAPRAPQPAVEPTATAAEYHTITHTQQDFALGMPEFAATTAEVVYSMGEPAEWPTRHTEPFVHYTATATTQQTVTTIRTGVFLSITGLHGAEILPQTNVPLQMGESVFALLQRETRARRIHMEHTGSAALGTVYIRGINNLYEFDHGELSGWKFRVNGEFVSVGVCRWQPRPNDVIELIYVTDFVF